MVGVKRGGSMVCNDIYSDWLLVLLLLQWQKQNQLVPAQVSISTICTDTSMVSTYKTHPHSGAMSFIGAFNTGPR